jgi:hypothetical protein
MFKFGIDWSENHHNLCIRNDKGGDGSLRCDTAEIFVG